MPRDFPHGRHTFASGRAAALGFALVNTGTWRDISAGAEFCPSTVFEIYKESLRSLLMLLLEIQCKMEIDSESISKNFQTQWHQKTFTLKSLKATDSLEVGTLLWASLAWRLAIGYHITVATEGAMYVCEPMSESSWHVQYAMCTVLGRLWPHKKTTRRPDVLRLHIQMTLCTCQAYPSFFMTGETHGKQPPSPSTTTHLCLCLYPLHLRLEWSIPWTIQVCICVIWQEVKKRCGFCHIHIRAVFAFGCANNLPNIKRLLSAATYEVPH